jgi:hypothetical protein
MTSRFSQAPDSGANSPLPCGAFYHQSLAVPSDDGPAKAGTVHHSSHERVPATHSEMAV